MSTSTNDQGSIKESGNFDKFLESVKEKALDHKAKNYHHTDVLIDAWQEGYKAGKSAKEHEVVDNFISNQQEKFSKKATLAYILVTTEMLGKLSTEGFSFKKLFINLHENNPKFLIAIDSDLEVDDSFISAWYKVLNNINAIFKNMYQELLDINFVAFDHLDENSVTGDGYEYSQNLDI